MESVILTSPRVHELLDELTGVAPGFRLTLVRELVDVGELTVALEILCDNLYDHDVDLPPTLGRRLVEACRQANVDVGYLSYLAGIHGT